MSSTIRWSKQDSEKSRFQELSLGGITGTSYRRNRNFDEWMHQCGISEEDRRFIRNFAGSGKLELEESVEKFFNELNHLTF